MHIVGWLFVFILFVLTILAIIWSVWGAYHQDPCDVAVEPPPPPIYNSLEVINLREVDDNLGIIISENDSLNFWDSNGGGEEGGPKDLCFASTGEDKTSELFNEKYREKILQLTPSDTTDYVTFALELANGSHHFRVDIIGHNQLNTLRIQYYQLLYLVTDDTEVFHQIHDEHVSTNVDNFSTDLFQIHPTKNQFVIFVPKIHEELENNDKMIWYFKILQENSRDI